MVNGSITKKELKNKYVFWDIDGTLAPYRFNGHTGDPDGTNNEMSLNEIEAGVFLLRANSQISERYYRTQAIRTVSGNTRAAMERAVMESFLLL